MPKVGNRRFPYTAEGIRQAQEYARKTGQALQQGSKTHSKSRPKRRVKR